MSTSLYLKLFELSDPLATRPLRLSIEGCSDWLTREQAYALRRGQLSKLECPLRLGAYRGRQATDFLWCALTPLVCISQRVVAVLEEQGFTGWSTYPVEVYDRQGEQLEGYVGFAITGRAGEQDLHRARVLIKPPWEGGKPREVLKGLYFQDDFWDGSDFCLMGSTITIIVTQRVVQAFKQAKIRNVRFTPLPEVETPASVYKVQGLWPLEKE